MLSIWISVNDHIFPFVIFLDSRKMSNISTSSSTVSLFESYSKIGINDQPGEFFFFSFLSSPFGSCFRRKCLFTLMASVSLHVGFCSFTLTNSVYVIPNFSYFFNFDHSFPIERSHSIIWGILYKRICKEIAKYLPKFYIKLQFCFISLKAE